VQLRRLVPTAVLAASLAAASLVASPSEAAAQAGEPEQVNSNAKGIIGLGLIGAELGFVIPAAAGLHETWSFIVFPVVGAVGGGLAGHYLIEENNQTEVAVAMLAVGLALVVPATVLTVKFSSYDPSRDQPPPPEASADGGQARAGVRRTYVSAPPLRLRPGDLVARSGMLRLRSEGLALGVPGVSLRANLDRREADLFGVDRTLAVHVPFLSGSF